MSSLIELFQTLAASLSARFPLRSKYGQIGEEIVNLPLLEKLMGKHGSAAMPVLDGVKAVLFILRLQGGRISKVCRRRIELINHPAHLLIHLWPPIDVSIRSMALVTESFAVIDLPTFFTISCALGRRERRRGCWPSMSRVDERKPNERAADKDRSRQEHIQRVV